MSIMPVATPPFVSEAEFLSLPESNQKAELVDGEVMVSPSQSYWHQEVLVRIVTREELLRDALTTERLPGFALDLTRLFADVA